MKRFKEKRSFVKHRCGAAVVELAICLPFLVVILVGTIEACVMLQLQQNLAVTAYEGSRIGIIPGTGAAAVQNQCQLLLSSRNIKDYSIVMTPADPMAMEVGDHFRVTVTADCDANSLIGGLFFQGKTLSESVTMKAE